jgi:SAM-dependent methyltransferase
VWRLPNCVQRRRLKPAATTRGFLKMSKKKIDYGLLFYREIFEIEFLHFGLWKSNDELNIENFKRAQQRYFEKLLSFIPEETKSILDVGCGTGVGTELLYKKGYDVEGLSPDKYQMEEFKKKLGEKVKFNLSRFNNFKPERKYNLVLMSESSQYINIDKIFIKTGDCLNKNGYLLIADYFRKYDKKYYKTCHILDNFLSKAGKNKFEIVQSEDITNNVVKTLDFGHLIFERYCNPMIRIISTYFENEYSFMVKIIKVIFERKLKKINYYLRVKTPEKLNSKKFIDELVYKIFLFKKC